MAGKVQNYSISAMCRKLGVPRSLVYYKKKRKVNSELENAVIEIFKKSCNNYCSRKIKQSDDQIA